MSLNSGRGRPGYWVTVTELTRRSYLLDTDSQAWANEFIAVARPELALRAHRLGRPDSGRARARPLRRSVPDAHRHDAHAARIWRAVSATGGFQYGGDPSEWASGDRAVSEVDDPLAQLENSGINWEGILNGNFDYVIEENDGALSPDFLSLPPDEFPAVFLSPADPGQKRFDVPDNYAGRGLLVVEGSLWINGDFAWDGVILIGEYMKSNGKMEIEGAILTGLNMLLGWEPGKDVAALGPKAQGQVVYNACMVGAAENAGSTSSNPPQGLGWVASW